MSSDSKQQDWERIIIAFTGNKGHGKDTAAIPFKGVATRLQFAYLLKKICSLMLGMDMDTQMNGLSKETIDDTWGVTPRQVMQVVGTDLFRNQLKKLLPTIKIGDGESLWAKRMEMEINDIGIYRDVVITDCRFIDEAAMVKRMGGVIVRVVRPGMECSDTHASEVEQASIEADYTLVNDGTEADLQEKAVALYEKLSAERLVNSFSTLSK